MPVNDPPLIDFPALLGVDEVRCDFACEDCMEADPYPVRDAWRMPINGVDYVGDRLVLVRADATKYVPPDDVSLRVMPVAPAEQPWMTAGYLDAPPAGVLFRSYYLDALTAAGCRLRRVDLPDADTAHQTCVILNAAGDPVGWIMPRRPDAALLRERRPEYVPYTEGV